MLIYRNLQTNRLVNLARRTPRGVLGGWFEEIDMHTQVATQIKDGSVKFEGKNILIDETKYALVAER